MPDLPLSFRDRAALAALHRAGSLGLLKSELGALLGSASGGSVAAFKKRVAYRGVAIRAVYLDRVGRVDEYRYVLTAGAAASPASVTRVVTGDLGLGATRGARVSVAFVSCLDGAGASADVRP